MSGSALRFNYDLLRLGRRVTDQQLWCLGWEEDVLALVGEEYRTRCIAEWQFRKRAIDPVEVPDTWRRIHRDVRALRSSHSSAKIQS